MSEEAKIFILGLEQSRAQKGMKWYGKIPSEIQELFQLNLSDIKHGTYIAGIYVEILPQYKPFTPAWMEDEK